MGQATFADDDLNGAVRLEPSEYFDQCLLGKTTIASGESVLVYDYEMLVKMIARDCADGQEVTPHHWQTAIEHLEFNTIRAIDYMGDRRPLIVYQMEEWDANDTEDGPRRDP